MKISDEITVGAHQLKIVYKDEEKDGFSRSARINNWTSQILLQKGLVESRRESALFHEIVHEIDYQFNLDLDERTTNAIAEMMYQTLKANDWLK